MLHKTRSSNPTFGPMRKNQEVSHPTPNIRLPQKRLKTSPTGSSSHRATANSWSGGATALPDGACRHSPRRLTAPPWLWALTPVCARGAVSTLHFHLLFLHTPLTSLSAGPRHVRKATFLPSITGPAAAFLIRATDLEKPPPPHCGVSPAQAGVHPRPGGLPTGTAGACKHGHGGDDRLRTAATSSL